ncbi:MAG: ABC transporter substrate-binding protein [Pseudomonadota bacterium]
MNRLLGSAITFAAVMWATTASALTLIETSTLDRTHDVSTLPPVAERVPGEPLIVDMNAKGRTPGVHGGDLNTLVGRAKDSRLINVWGYARLVGFDGNFELQPDILKDVDVEDGRIFTFHLREGHKWSDGAPFTAEDFRYYFEDIILNEDLTPSGIPGYLKVGDAEPTFEVIDETTVRFSWSVPNPSFLTELAKARPPFIYRPAHYLKQFHAKYGDEAEIAKLVEENKARSWASLHNKRDDMYNGRNLELPTLQPWAIVDEGANQRFQMTRNPFFHRVDGEGRQLPYIDRIIMSVTDGRLVAAKTRAGESDLQARNLAFSDITVLKQGEIEHGYKTALWPIAKASHITLYPNLNVTDPVWRELIQDARFRKALSHSIDRKMINNALYFRLGVPSNNTVLETSPLFDPMYRDMHTAFDVGAANAILDQLGLTERRSDGVRLLPDGRPLEIIVETFGESAEHIDVLELIKETWAEAGVALFPKPSQRDNVRRRAYSGELLMSIFEGFNNGVPTPVMSPAHLAPTNHVDLSWAAWGDHYESSGKDGIAPDMDVAAQLLDLYSKWQVSSDNGERERIWKEMLEIHASEMLTIGIVSKLRQPVAISPKLRNVPLEGIYGWDPGAQFGIHRMDEFWIDPSVQ